MKPFSTGETSRLVRPLLAGFVFLLALPATPAFAAGIEFAVLGTEPERAHSVRAGTQTTFVISVFNNTLFRRTLSARIRSVGPDASEWSAALSHTDHLFQPSGAGAGSLTFTLTPFQRVHLSARLSPSANRQEGDEGAADVTLFSGPFLIRSATLRATVRNRPKIYFAAIDACAPGYLYLDRHGNALSAGAERLMPRAWEFMSAGALLTDARSLMPTATDPNYLAALSGSWPGTVGVHAIFRYYAGRDANGRGVALNGSRDLMRWGPDGAPIQTIFDVLKDPASGGSADVVNAFVTGKNWMSDFFADDAGTVDVMANGASHPSYVRVPVAYRLGDPPSDPDAATDREGTNVGNGPFAKLYSLQAQLAGLNPKVAPEDRWTAEAAIRIIAVDDPDVLVLLLADADTAQHVFGAADRPEEWTDPGTPGVLWDDANAYNAHANRDPILDVLYEADENFGLFVDVLRSRGVFDGSIVTLFSDHGQTTMIDPGLDIDRILVEGGVAESVIERINTSGEFGYVYLADPQSRELVETVLESYQALDPVSNTFVHPYLVLNREEMDSGIDNVEGPVMEDWLPGNKRGELYSEWNIEHPVSDNSKVRWPDLAVLTRHHFQHTNNLVDDVNVGTVFYGHHGSPQSQAVILGMHAPTIRPGTYDDEVTLADIVPTIYRILEVTPPAHTDGKVIESILSP